MVEERRVRGAIHVALLWSLTASFAFRTAAQLVRRVSPVRALPPFDAWQGSSLSYPVLLASQSLILVLMCWLTHGVSGRVRARRRIGAALLALGGVYFAAMSVRLVLGLTILADVSWFAKPLPALFHLVLAGYLLTLGHYHWQRADRGRGRAGREP
jgi:hypothetical protein